MIAFLFLIASAFVLAFFLAVNDPAKGPAVQTGRPKRRAYVLGVNYGGDNASDDEGCWKDVADYAEALGKSGIFEPHEVFKYVNDRAEGKHFTSKPGMQRLLSKIVARSHEEYVPLVHVHFCGRATSEGIETSDGDVIDTDWLIAKATSFPLITHVVMTFDCVFNGTLERTEERDATLLSGESITHAFLDALKNKPRLMNNANDLCAHVEDYIGVRPILSSTLDVLDFPSFMHARNPA